MNELKCGCRPADRFCEDAEEMRFQLKLTIACHGLVSAPDDVRESLAEIGAAERALRDHLRGIMA